MGIKDRSGNYTRFITYLVVIVLINAVGITLFFRFDLTSNRIFSLSEASKEVVSTLSEPLTINVFFTKNLPAPHNTTERYLHDLLEEYSINANQYFNYRFYDVSPEEGDITQETRLNQELAKDYGIKPVQIQAVEKDEVKFQMAYMGLVLIHGDIIERIPAITSTDRLEYQLTTAIQKLNNKVSALLRLPDKINVKLFLSSSLDIVAPFMGIEGLPELGKKVEEIVGDLNRKNYGKLEFQHIDTSKNPEMEKELEKYNIPVLEWPEIPEKDIMPGKGNLGLILEYANKVTTIPLLKVLRLPLVGTQYQLVDPETLDDVINGSIESIIEINENIGYLADHDCPPLWKAAKDSPGMPSSDSLANFNALVSQTYTVKEIHLADEVIPEGINCLLIVGPKKSFTDYELFQIDQFLMKGNNLALFIDAFREEQPDPNDRFSRDSVFYPLNTGLEKLLEHYGASVKKSYVMDANCYYQEVPQYFGGGEKAIYFIPYILNEFINKDLPFMKNIKGLVMPVVSPLEINMDRIKENGLRAHKLLASSEKAWEMKGYISLNPASLRPPMKNTELKSMPVAYLIEGEFPSYFADKPIPEKEVEGEDTAEKTDEQASKDEEMSKDEKTGIDLSKIKSEGILLSKGKPGKIFLIASTEILKNFVIEPEGQNPNSIFIMNVIDYLNNREATAVMRSKEYSFNPLAPLSGKAKIFIKYFNIIGLPLLVVVFGLLVWLRRHYRKNKIQMMFQTNE